MRCARAEAGEASAVAARTQRCLGTRGVEWGRERVGSRERDSQGCRRWAACERVAMRNDCRGGDEGGALIGGEASDAAKRGLEAVWASQGLGARLGVLVDGRRSGRGEQELKTAQGSALGGVQQTEGADAVQAAQGDMLEEAAQKLVGGQGHVLADAVTAVSVGEGDGASVAGGDGLVAESSAMDVASEVVEHGGRASDGFGEDDPALVPRDRRQPEGGHGPACEVEEAAAETLGQCGLGHEEGLIAMGRNEPGPTIGSEAARGHEQVDVRVPLESASPGVEDGERADVSAEPVRVGTQCGERVERGAEEGAEQSALMLAHGAAQLRREREDDMEVRNGQEQLALALHPLAGGIVAATRASAVVAGMKEYVLASAHGAHGEVATERSGATA